MPRIPLNKQKIEPQLLDAKGRLEVQSIWYTIQGEGPYSGCPAAFVRLTGCNLKCPYCDTDYTSVRKVMSPDEIILESTKVRDGASYLKERISSNLIVLTGGEPFRQNIIPLLIQATGCGWHVQIETNGTLWVNHFDHLYRDKIRIVCSPKTEELDSRLMKRIDDLKYVINADAIDDDGLPNRVLGMPCKVARPWSTFSGDIYISPEDSQIPEQNKRNVEAAVKVCMQHGYRLSLQTHKIVGVA